MPHPVILLLVLCLGLSATLSAGEVEKEAIPVEHLARTLTVTPWQSPIWDVPQAAERLRKTDQPILWVDTRPKSFFATGTVRRAVNLAYDRSDRLPPPEEHTLNRESLAQAVQAAGLDPATVTIVFFCQGPKCHRSYNAAYTASTAWGWAPERVVWFRDGYPVLLNAVREDPKLKRKAESFLDDAGVGSL